jgi:hypothetical protein
VVAHPGFPGQVTALIRVVASAMVNWSYRIRLRLAPRRFGQKQPLMAVRFRAQQRAFFSLEFDGPRNQLADFRVAFAKGHA